MRLLRCWMMGTALVVLGACAGTREMAPPTPVAAAPEAATAAVVDNYQLDMLQAIAWSRTSAEAEALYLQAYGLARGGLDRALADPTWTAAVEQTGDFSKLPAAIIVDVDETVLDTSDYMVERLRSGREFSNADWNQYVLRANAPPLPGALEFLKYAASRGVSVFYVSNRAATPVEPGLQAEVEATRKNLAQYGFPNTADTRNFLFRDGARGWKEKGPRRAEIAKSHRIVMLAGDNLYDFIDVADANRSKRDTAVEDHASWLGTRWIVLPNPVYGSWDSLIIGHSKGADARRARLESIGVPAAVADSIARGGFEP
jgi:5'-nucleotidase (lipoprotein e(P4) family)